jgi:hypothetical protein
LDGAEPGCNGAKDCWQVEETQWRTIAGNLEDRLQGKGYTVKQLDLNDDIGLRVYEIIQHSSAKFYLHLLSTSQGTVFLMHPKVLSREELHQMANEPI